MDETFNTSALRGKIIEEYRTINNFAIAMGISRQHLSNLLSGKAHWTVIKMRKAVKLLKIEDQPGEIYRIFFAE